MGRRLELLLAPLPMLRVPTGRALLFAFAAASGLWAKVMLPVRLWEPERVGRRGVVIGLGGGASLEEGRREAEAVRTVRGDGCVCGCVEGELDRAETERVGGARALDEGRDDYSIR